MKTQRAAESLWAMFALLNVGIALAVGAGSAEAAALGSNWGANYFPNIPLVTQDGENVRFYDDLVKGKVVAINFIFTRCTDACPVETANLRQVEKLLGERVGRDVFFYSISLDPERDTPAELKAYAQKFNTGPGWKFLTGNQADITLLRKKLGLYSGETQGEPLRDHHISLVMGNESKGQWIKRSLFDDPMVLARLLGDSLPDRVASRANVVSYAQAPRLATLSRGEELFRSRCDSCHSLGTKDGLGPGLAGVTTKRDKVWLARWLKSPDRLLADQDPIATSLFNKYKRLAMPNLKLSDPDVDALIAYMEARNQSTAQAGR